MGTLTSTLGTISSTIGTVATLANQINDLNGYNNRVAAQNQQAQQSLAMQNLQQQQAQELKESEFTATEKRAKIQTEAQQAEELRRTALRRTVARQNALFGSRGITGNDGSREAVLLGLYNESEEDKKQREDLDRLRYNAIDSDLNTLKERNVLELSQLTQQQRLQRAINDY